MMSSQPMDLAEVALDEACSRIAAASIKTLDLAALAHVEPTPKHFIVPKLAPAGEVTLFTGPGGAGKSLLAQQLATSVAAGVSTLGLEIQQAPAIYLTCEDDEGQLHLRQKYICLSLAVSVADLDGKLHLASLRGALDNALGSVGVSGEFEPTEAYQRIIALIRLTGAKFVALDNVAHLFVGNENNRGEVTCFINALNRLAGETGAAILLLGHPNKGGDNYSGSTAWLNAVRSQIVIEHDDATDMRTLTVCKANYVRKGETIRFAWIDWAFVHADVLPSDKVRKLAENARANADNETFLRCLRERNRQKRAVSEKRCAPTYAPKEFADMSESKGIGRERLEKAMDRLFRENLIERGKLPWDDGHRHPVEGLKEAAGNLAGDTSRLMRETQI